MAARVSSATHRGAECALRSSRSDLATGSRTRRRCSRPRTRPSSSAAGPRRPSPGRVGELRQLPRRSADGGRRGGHGGAAAGAPAAVSSAWCSTSAGSTARSRPAGRGQRRPGRDATPSPAQPGRDASAEMIGRWRADRRRRQRPRCRRLRDHRGARSAARSRARSTAERGRALAGEAPTAGAGGDRPGRHHRRRRPGRGARRSRAVRKVAPRHRRCARTSTTPATPATPTLSPRSRPGVDVARRQPRRHRRLPVRPERHRQHRHRGPRLRLRSAPASTPVSTRRWSAKRRPG